MKNQYQYLHNLILCISMRENKIGKWCVEINHTTKNIFLNYALYLNKKANPRKF
jgi:hypothetical protein